MDQRAAILENGDQYRDALTTFGKDPRAQQVSVKVKAVDVSGLDQATVTYDVFLAGQSSAALPNATGKAVYQSAAWKVSADSFCGLVALAVTSGTKVAGCA